MKYELYLGDEKLAEVESCEVEQEHQKTSDGFMELVDSRLLLKEDEE